MLYIFLMILLIYIVLSQLQICQFIRIFPTKSWALKLWVWDWKKSMRFTILLCSTSVQYIWTVYLYNKFVPYIFTVCMYRTSLQYIYAVIMYSKSVQYNFTMYCIVQFVWQYLWRNTNNRGFVCWIKSKLSKSYGRSEIHDS